jgi:hypothetical protein
MSLEQWIAAFTDVREFVGDFSVQFGGGEPFVFKPFSISSPGAAPPASPGR